MSAPTGVLFVCHANVCRSPLAEAVFRDRAIRAGLEAASGRLEALSPVAVLGRGYAVALHEGRAVRDPTGLEPGAALEVRLHAGTVDAVVEAVRPLSS